MRAVTLALLSLGAAIVLVMVGLSQHAWRVLPADAKVPLNWGPGSRGNWVPKKTALLAYPGIGLAVYLIASATLAGHGKQELAGVPLALILVTLAQYRAISAAQTTQPT
jgi:hypothetical protein